MSLHHKKILNNNQIFWEIIIYLPVDTSILEVRLANQDRSEAGQIQDRRGQTRVFYFSTLIHNLFMQTERKPSIIYGDIWF